MKKLMFAAALMAAGAAMAVESDVVGYTSRSIEPGTWVLTAIQFEGVGGGEDVMLSDLVKGNYTSVNVEDDFENTAPHIMVPDGEGYIDWFYCNYEGMGEFWFDRGNPDPGTPLAAGTGIWFCHHEASACNVSFAGQVISDSSVPVVAASGTWKIVSNPFPKTFRISLDATYEGAVSINVEGDFETQAPHIMLVDGEGYIDWYYCNAEGYGDFWFDRGNPDDGTANSPVGTAFWFKAPTEVTINFAR